MPDDVPEWHDLYKHASSLARLAGRTDLAERIHALAELVSQTVRFADRQSLEEVLARRHVADMIAGLVWRDGTARRTLLAEASGLAEANLSRVLAILEAHGLIRRRRADKEVIVSLTDEGQRAASGVMALSGGATSYRQSRDVDGAATEDRRPEWPRM